MTIRIRSAPALLGFAALLAAPPLPAAGASDPDFGEMSLADLLDVPVEIAARGRQRAEEAPSIVTVVTRAEIEAWGARDLAEVLRLAGGFEFAIDVESLVGLSFRGAWVHEGK